MKYHIYLEKYTDPANLRFYLAMDENDRTYLIPGKRELMPLVTAEQEFLSEDTHIRHVLLDTEVNQEDIFNVVEMYKLMEIDV